MEIVAHMSESSVYDVQAPYTYGLLSLEYIRMLAYPHIFLTRLDSETFAISTVSLSSLA